MKLGVLGSGKMGSAIAKAALRNGILVYAYDNDAKKAGALKRYGARVSATAAELVKKSDAVLIAVKPKDVSGLLESVGKLCKGKLIVSIAACVGAEFISRRAKGSRVIRVIPNIPVEVGVGASSYALGRTARKSDEGFVKKLFGSAGIIERVKEDELDAAMVVASCSPAFYALVINALAEEGARFGLERKRSIRLAAGACVGTGAMILASGKEPEELAAMVATPGGVTAEGLDILAKNKTWKIFHEAAKGSYKKSRLAGKLFRR